MRNKLHILTFAVVATVIMCACASIGHPEGGPRDYMPPRLVASSPVHRSLGVNPKQITLTFDENIEVQDPLTKITLSPRTGSAPIARALGKKLTVTLRDTLAPGTTYTLDLSDAVKDLNEGNVLDGLAIQFATGDTLDTMRISGIAFEALTLEPITSLTVVASPDTTDTIYERKPFSYITRTNARGQFTLRGLRPIPYRLYAVADKNNDNLWDMSEDIGFHPVAITPWTAPTIHADTLQDHLGRDSIVTHPATLYLPNDIILTVFNQDKPKQYIQNHHRPEREQITLQLATRADTLPTLTLLSDSLPPEPLTPPMALLDANATCDTLTLWLRDRRHIDADTLKLGFALRLSADSTMTDTLTLTYKAPKKNKKDEARDSLPPTLSIKALSQPTHDIGQPLRFALTQPIGVIDTAMFHFETLDDTTWVALPMPPLNADPTHPLTQFILRPTLKPGAKYRLSADSAAVRSIYDIPAKALRHEFQMRREEDYATLGVSVTTTDTTAMVLQLLDQNDKAVRTVALPPSGTVTLQYISPGTYYARVFFDTNGDTLYTPGDIHRWRQPEASAYYPRAIKLRANWENQITWDPYAIPLDGQKPLDILKNKPKGVKAKKDDSSEDGEEDYDPNDPFGTNRRSGSGSLSIPGIGSGSRQQSTGLEATPRRR